MYQKAQFLSPVTQKFKKIVNGLPRCCIIPSLARKYQFMINSTLYLGLSA